MHPKFGALRTGLAAAFAAFVLTSAPATVFAAEKAAAPQALGSTFVEAAKSNAVDVTVYGSSFAQIEETRTIKLSAGRNRIQLNGIASQYRPDSLRVLDVKGTGTFSYKSAIYQPANLTSERILADSVGQALKATVGTGHLSRQVNGTLVAVNGGQLVIKGDDGNTYLATTNDVVLAAMPAGLSNTASLIVEADVTTAGDYQLHFLYETGGMTWSSKHSLVYDDGKQKLDSFETTVNVINESGTSFENATLWLLSGDVPASVQKGISLRAASYDAAPESANVQSVGERKVYRIPGTVSLKDGQSRQIPLFSGSNVEVVREFYLPAESPYYYRGDAAGGMTPVSVRLRIKNCSEHNLGMPLPAGAVKVYQRNNEDRLQLTASTQVKELATDEIFELAIGTSSDIKAERTMTKAVNVAGQQPPNPNMIQEFQDQTFDVKVHNFKDKKAVDVVVEVSVPQDQKNIAAPLTRKSATLATGTVHVESGKESTLSYTLRVRTR